MEKKRGRLFMGNFFKAKKIKMVGPRNNMGKKKILGGLKNPIFVGMSPPQWEPNWKFFSNPIFGAREIFKFFCAKVEVLFGFFLFFGEKVKRKFLWGKFLPKDGNFFFFSPQIDGFLTFLGPQTKRRKIF